MTLRELLTGLAPGDQSSTTQKPIGQALQASAPQAEQPGYCELADLLRDMTAEDPGDRLDAREVWRNLEAIHQAVKRETYAVP